LEVNFLGASRTERPHQGETWHAALKGSHWERFWLAKVGCNPEMMVIFRQHLNMQEVSIPPKSCSGAFHLSMELVIWSVTPASSGSAGAVGGFLTFI